ncbi:MAG: DUF47 domain-containing protein [Bacillota bacterium]
MLNLKPSKPIYFELFSKNGQAISQAARILKETVNDMSKLETNMATLKRIESEGDEITRQLLDELNSALITPFDREDVFRLAQFLDDILDYIYCTADRMILYRATEPTQCVKELAEVLADVCARVEKAVCLLNKVSANQEEIVKLCREINSLESRGDAIFRAGIQSLFDTAKDPMDFIRWKEIYEHMEHLLDLCEDVGDVLKGVVLKYA